MVSLVWQLATGGDAMTEGDAGVLLIAGLEVDGESGSTASVDWRVAVGDGIE